MPTSAPTNGSPWISATAEPLFSTGGHPIIGIDMFKIGAPELAHQFLTETTVPANYPGVVIDGHTLVARATINHTFVLAESFTKNNVADGPPVVANMNPNTGMGTALVHLSHVGDYVKTFTLVETTVAPVMDNGQLSGLGQGDWSNYGAANGWSAHAVSGMPGHAFGGPGMHYS